MLLKCPECELQVSDKAYICPHCGYPFQPLEKIRRTAQKKKHLRLPNGFGQISEIKNRNLRKPFRAMLTVGKDENGKPICKPLKPEAYFETYQDAYAALVEYHKNPYDLDPSITMRELFADWLAIYEKKVKSTKAMELAWNYCEAVYDMRVKDIRARHIKLCMEEGRALCRGEMRSPNAIMKNHIKSLFNLMLDHALEYELVERNYARTFHLSEEIIREIMTVKQEHIPFSDAEMARLWQNLWEKEFVDIILIQCYSGWRPQEIGQLKTENVNLAQGLFSGGMKSDAGTGRIVPIHPRIYPLVEQNYRRAKEMGSPHLFNPAKIAICRGDAALNYARFRVGFARLREELQLSPWHRPHDGRKHFVTMAKKYGVDEYAIKYMVGHKISDITERVYTQREVEWLREEIRKIK